MESSKGLAMEGDSVIKKKEKKEEKRKKRILLGVQWLGVGEGRGKVALASSLMVWIRACCLNNKKQRVRELLMSSWHPL